LSTKGGEEGYNYKFSKELRKKFINRVRRGAITTVWPRKEDRARIPRRALDLTIGGKRHMT
jgi:hypothetical protein